MVAGCRAWDKLGADWWPRLPMALALGQHQAAAQASPPVTSTSQGPIKTASEPIVGSWCGEVAVWAQAGRKSPALERRPSYWSKLSGRSDVIGSGLLLLLLLLRRADSQGRPITELESGDFISSLLLPARPLLAPPRGDASLDEGGATCRSMFI